MNWKWLLTGAEPRSRYALLVAVGVVVMISLTYPIWSPGGRGMAVFAFIAAIIISHLSAKLIMRR